MISKKEEQTYFLIIHGKEYEAFFAEDGHIEIYESKNPGNTGFIFNNIKEISAFVNDLSDAIEMERNYIK